MVYLVFSFLNYVSGKTGCEAWEGRETVHPLFVLMICACCGGEENPLKGFNAEVLPYCT